MANHYRDIYPSYQPHSFPPDILHINSALGAEPPTLGISDKDRNLDSVQHNFNPMSYPDTSTTPSPSSLDTSTSTEGPGPSSPPFLLPDILDVVHPAASHQTRRLRRDKPRIDLASDQPPTTQGRPRARVFVACLQWYDTSSYRGLVALILLSLAEPARSVATERSRSASTVLSVKGITSVLTMLYQSVVGLIRFRERVLVVQGRRMKIPLEGAGAAGPRQSIKPLVGHMTLYSQALPSSTRSSIPRKFRFSLSTHSNMAFAFMNQIPGSNTWKAARC